MKVLVINRDEGNRIIAEFMGWKVAGYVREYIFFGKKTPYFKRLKSEPQLFIKEGLCYDKDWNMLIPVIEFIDKHTPATLDKFRPGILSFERSFALRKTASYVRGIPIDEMPPISESTEYSFRENAFIAVVDCIQWLIENNLFKIDYTQGNASDSIRG